MFKKILSTLAVVFIAVFALAGCSEKYDFYADFKEAGAKVLPEDHVFEVITLDDAKAKIGKEDFIVFLGSSKDATVVSDVDAISYDAINTNFTGKLYYVSLNDYTKVSDKKAINEALNIKYEDSGDGLIAVRYDKTGKQLFETTRPNDYCWTFDTTSKSQDDIKNINIDIHAVAAYAFDLVEGK